MAKRRKKSRSKQLDEDLDRASSCYTRLKNSWMGKDGKPLTKCVTCGAVKKAINGRDCMQSGHFIGRKWMAVRWDIRNQNPQCASCNVFQSGEQYLHSQYIDEVYGEGTAQELSDKRRDRKPDILEREELLEFYIKQLLKLGYEFKQGKAVPIRQSA